MKNKSLLILMLFTLVPIASYGQNEDLLKAYSDFSSAASRSYTSFQDSVNTAFSQALKKNWEEFKVLEAKARGTSPKPVIAPSKPEPAVDMEQPVVSEPEVKDTVALQAEEPKPHQSIFGCAKKAVSFSFYGSPQTVNVPVSYGMFHPSGISEEVVGDFWARLSKEDYSDIVRKCQSNRDNFGYNDWAILEWNEALAKAIYPDDKFSERVVFTVFVLNQLGLDVRLSRVDDALVALYSCKQDVYSCKYMVMDSRKYYIVDSGLNSNSVYTYRNDFSTSSRPVDLRFKRPLELSSERTVAQKSSSVLSRDIKIPICRSKIDFYSGYPQTSVDVYAESVPSEDFSKALLSDFQASLGGLSPQERIKSLLRFLQYDFNYQIDQEQFSKEKPFFFEENFCYAANDCEDRAILFSFLVRHLTDNKVILLEWDDHVATAVEFPAGGVEGTYVKSGERKYYICDPTYIGGTIGMCMPGYEKRAVKVYTL